MNRHPDDHEAHEGVFHTHRSERYRHPEQEHGNRFDEHGASARSAYGNERSLRHYTDINVTPYDRFEQSRNYGSMGSYGGAQGFGDIRGGHHDSNHPFDSGTGEQRRYGQQRQGPSGYREDREEHRNYGRSRGWDRDREDLYGHEVSRRFQGSQGQQRYDFERDDYYSSNYGDDQGNYMGSGYHRSTESRYGTGDYGSSGFMEQNRQSGERRSHEFNTAQNRRNADW